MSLSHPIITSNVDAILKHQAKFVTSSSDIVIESNNKRVILLSAFTTGATLKLGPGGTTSENFGVGDDLETNFTTTVANIPVIPNTVIIKIDDVTQGTDDGAGNITGAGISTGTIVYSTGAVDVTFSSAPALDEIVSITYTGFIVGQFVTITAPVGTTKWDLSSFFKNAPFAFAQSNTGLIISPATSAETVVAYVETKGD